MRVRHEFGYHERSSEATTVLIMNAYLPFAILIAPGKVHCRSLRPMMEITIGRPIKKASETILTRYRDCV